MEKRYKKLIKNSVIFAIGTFGSKLLSFLIVPLYTYFLTRSEYGTVDLFTTTINLILPFITFSIQQAAIRFIVSKEADEKTVLNNCLVVFLCGSALSILLTPIFHLFIRDSTLLFAFVLILILNSYNVISVNFLQAIEKTVAFSINGILFTFVIVFSNLITIVYLHMGIYGYIFSILLSQLISSIHATICGHILKKISVHSFNKDILKQMLKFSIPLIPNHLMWWIMNSGDKYIIFFFLGESANGIYSVSTKIPTILTLIFSIFMQAWQLSALSEAKSPERTAFFEDVFKKILAILILCASFITLLIYPLFKLIISEEFFESWKYVPFLSISTILDSIATFSGITYILTKKSERAFITTLIGAILNLLANFLLIIPLGLFGVALGTIIGYAFVAIIRMKDISSNIPMSFESPKIVISFLILLAESVTMVFLPISPFSISSDIACVFILFIIFRKEILSLIKPMLKLL